VAAAGGSAAVAWFTLRDGSPEVRLAFTDHAGASYSEPILIDSGNAEDVDGGSPRQVAGLADASDEAHPIPLGRVDVAWMDDEHVAVTWVVARGADAEIVWRRVARDGTLGARQVVANTGSMRASGFPRMVRQGDRLVLAWTRPGSETGVHSAVIARANE
jgi:hypothetical protein